MGLSSAQPITSGLEANINLYECQNFVFIRVDYARCRSATMRRALRARVAKHNPSSAREHRDFLLMIFMR